MVTGHITLDSLDHVNELTEKQLLAELKFLRYTTAPDIRQMRRVKVDCIGIQNAVIHYFGTQAIHQQCYQTGNSHCVEYKRTVTEFNELS